MKTIDNLNAKNASFIVSKVEYPVSKFSKKNNNKQKTNKKGAKNRKKQISEIIKRPEQLEWNFEDDLVNN